MSTDNSRPMFTVVIPVFNRAETVRPTLLSVQEQTCGDFECIVVDDGSRDSDSLSSVVASMGDRRFLYVRQDNGGASSARNRGLDLARGGFVALLDSDDRFLPRKLEKCMEVVEGAEDVLVFSQMIVERGMEKKWVRPDRGPEGEERIDEYILCTPGTIRTSTIVISSGLARRIRFDESLPWFQDSDFAIRAANDGALVKFIREPLISLEDKVGYNRVSRDKNYTLLLDYFDKKRAAGEISDRAYWAGRGWPCARVASSSNRPYAIILYLQALIRFVFPWRHAIIVAAQVIIPYRTYQAVANLVVRLRGRRLS